MATVGEDFSEYRATLEEVGVDTDLMKVIPGEFTASFFCNTDQSNAQIASFYPGAMDHAGQLSFHDLVKLPDWVVISPNSPDSMVKYPQECVELGIPYLYDPSQQIPRMTGEDLRSGVEGASALMVNYYEFELIKKQTGMQESKIFEGMRFTVITRGNHGASRAGSSSLFESGAVSSGPGVSWIHGLAARAARSYDARGKRHRRLRRSPPCQPDATFFTARDSRRPRWPARSHCTVCSPPAPLAGRTSSSSSRTI